MLSIPETPQTSPLAYSNTTITIAIPTNAAEIHMRPSTDMRVSSTDNTDPSSGGPYFVIPGGVMQPFGVSGIDNIYIVRDTADGTLNFFFVTV